MPSRILLIVSLIILGLVIPYSDCALIVQKYKIFDTTPSRNSDFESAQWLANPRTVVPEQGLVQPLPSIDPFGEKVPVYNYPGPSPGGEVKSVQNFQAYFTPTPGVSLFVDPHLPYPPPMVYDSGSGGYVFQSDAFFPIDNQGFSDKFAYPNEPTYYDQNNVEHNFHFCFHIEATGNLNLARQRTYTYPDGDMWIYINGYIQHPIENTVTVDGNYHYNFDIYGRNVDFDIFYCQKSTQRSRIKFIIPFDQCGARECCSDADCDPILYCQNATCDIELGVCHGAIGGTCVGSGFHHCYKYQCTTVGSEHICEPVLSCVGDPPCITATCDEVNGCIKTRQCFDGLPCTIDQCNPINGSCTHIDTCIPSDLCHTTRCDPATGTCVETQINCDDGFACTIDQCNPINGSCTHIDTCVPSDLCHTSQCDPVTGTCIETPINCDDGFACTIDQCINGTCTHIVTSCVPSDLCHTSQCDPVTGTCIETPINCDDGDPNTIDSCVDGVCIHRRCDDNDICTENILLNGTCIFTLNCMTKDLCSPKTCDQVKGCVANPINCNDYDPCTEDTCKDGKCNHKNICPTSCVPTPGGEGDGCPYGMYCAIVQGCAQCIVRPVPVCNITVRLGEDDGCPYGTYCAIIDSVPTCVERLTQLPPPIRPEPSKCIISHPHSYQDCEQCSDGECCVPFNQTCNVGRCLPIPPHPSKCIIPSYKGEPSGCPRGTHCIVIGERSLCVPNNPKTTFCTPNYTGEDSGCPCGSYCVLINGCTHCIPERIVLARGKCKIHSHGGDDGCPKGMLCAYINHIPSCISI